MRIINGGSETRRLPTFRAMAPISVCRPVALTIPWARPWVMIVPAKQKSKRSARGISSGIFASADLVTARDSPVSMDSSTERDCAIRSFRSAGTLLPEESSTRSPGTTSLTSMVCALPSRITWAVPRTISRSAEADFCAEYSCPVPIPAFNSRTAPMKTALGI